MEISSLSLPSESLRLPLINSSIITGSLLLVIVSLVPFIPIDLEETIFATCIMRIELTITERVIFHMRKISVATTPSSSLSLCRITLSSSKKILKRNRSLASSCFTIATTASCSWKDMDFNVRITASSSSCRLFWVLF